MFGRAGRHAIAGLILLGLLGSTAACTSAQASSTPTPSHRPAPVTSTSPSAPSAAMAGGACLLMDYKVINTALGTQFDVAGAADKTGTYTCVIRGEATYPDLTLSITSTPLTPTDFTADIQPAGSTSVTNLGKIGYVEQVKATSAAGPGIEVGWLSGNDRLIVMRYTDALNATPASSLTDGMVSLARTVDATTV